MFLNAKSKNEDILEHITEDASMEYRFSPEELDERYKEAKRFTSAWSLALKTDISASLRDEVLRRNKARQNKEKEKVSKKKSDLRTLANEVSKICHQQDLDGLFS